MAKLNTDGYLSYELKIGSKTFKSEGPLVSIHTHLEMFRVPFAVVSFVDGDPANQEFKLSSEAYLNPGTKVNIKLGYKGKTTQVFDGVIIRHKVQIRNKSSVVVLECKHNATKLTIGRKTRYFEKKDDKKIITTLFSENGLSSALACSGSFVNEDVQFQYDVTDWDYFIARCEVNSKIVAFDGKKFQVKDPKISGSAKRSLEYGKDLFEFESEVDARTQLKKVQINAWDVEKQKPLLSVAKATGFTQLENAGIKAKELTSVASPASMDYFHAGVISKSELDSWGKARNTKSGLSKVKGRFKIYGDPELKLGDVIELKGIGKKFSGKIMITAIRHELTTLGFYSHIQFGLSEEWFHEKHAVSQYPAAGITPAVSGLQIGKVLKIDGDPQHRIQVSLPLSGKATKIWARMLFNDAGSKRGFVFWPEKDDEVIVGFMNDDPRFPVILGSVYSKKNAPAIKPDAKNFKRAIVSKKDIRITFDDEKKTLELKTPGGQTITIDDDGPKIEIKDKTGNKITMESGGITLDSKKDITLKAAKNVVIKGSGDVTINGKNITAKAMSKFAANGNSGSELKSGGVTTVKGSMVQIN